MKTRSIFLNGLNYPAFTLKIYPTIAVSPMAAVPQNVILIIAFFTLDPPVFAATAPKIIKKRRANPYSEYSMVSKGKNKHTKSGNIPPTVNAVPDANAACSGLA